MGQTMFSAKAITKLMVLTSIFLVSGCASLTHYNKKSTSDIGKDNNQQTLSIDAKQRVVLTTVNSNQIRTCAEPSPDALSAIAASQGFSLNDGSLEAALNSSLSEGASSIGLRTQSIQLMRDAMYRLCEGYMSGSLDNLTFETLQRRFQTTMVAILAIEQLTGTVRAPAVSIGGDAAAGNAELVAKYTELSESRKPLLEAAISARDTHKEGAYKTTKDALDAKKLTVGAEDGNTTNALTDAEKVKLKTEQDAFDAEETKSKAYDETVKARQADYDSANAARLAALSGSSSVTRKVEIESTDITNDSAHAVAVANAVEGIVKSTLELGFAREFCATILVNNVKTNHDSMPVGTKAVHDGCVKYMNTNTQIRTAEADLILRKGQIVDKVLASNASTTELIALLNTLNGHVVSTPSETVNAPAPFTKTGFEVSKNNTSSIPERSVPARIVSTSRRVVKTPARSVEKPSYDAFLAGK